MIPVVATGGAVTIDYHYGGVIPVVATGGRCDVVDVIPTVATGGAVTIDYH